MIFDIKVKANKNIRKYSSNSAEVFFCSSNKEFDDLTKEIKINNLQSKKFKSDKNSELRFWKEKNPDLTIIKKIDIDDKFNVDYFRNYTSEIVKSLKDLNVAHLYIHIPDFKNFEKYFENQNYFFQSFTEGFYLGNYTFDIYKEKKSKPKLLNILLIAEQIKDLSSSILNANATTDGVLFSRDLVNEPANTLTPAEYAKRVRAEFRSTKVKVRVMDEKEITKRKMNAIMSVGKASVNQPRLIIAHYKPSVKNPRKIALVGKGVTYDTGGLSIKPTNGMLEMKADMAGSATVFGIIKSAEKLKLPIELIGIVPAVENVISGNAYKPGDVISSASGKTIEVKDTDAEGRIILADGLDYASKQKPDEIIDFATLTGAVAVALGLFTAGIFTKNSTMSKNILEAGALTYEHVWELPFWDEYNKLLESKIADVSNLGPRWGGAITAGKFLEHFVDEKIPWTHIDLAGPALSHDLTSYTKDYCTGFGVRLILKYLELIS